jgi:SagB-type dehydrogenase family enzyme
MERNGIFVQNPKLLVYLKVIDDAREFVAETDSGNPPLLLKAPEAIRAIVDLPKQFTRDQVFKAWSEYGISETLHQDIWQELLEEKIFLSILDTDYQKFLMWEKYQWQEAYRYHFSTKGYPFIQMDGDEGMEEDTRRMNTYYKECPPPSLYKTRSFSERIELKKTEDIFFDEIGGQSDEEISMNDLSLLFDLTFGERQKVEFRDQGLFLNKAIPSGGARHPTESYFFSFNDCLLKPGLYHYNVQHNSLDLIKSGDFYNECENITFDLFERYENKPKGLLVLTSVVDRAMWRYRESRSWRAILFDIGHALALFRKVSDYLGVQTYSYQKFKDAELNKMLGLDRYEESALYVCSIV